MNMWDGRYDPVSQIAGLGGRIITSPWPHNWMAIHCPNSFQITYLWAIWGQNDIRTFTFADPGPAEYLPF